MSGLAATMATVTLSSGFIPPLPVQGPVTHEHHLEVLLASSRLGDLSAIPERGLPLPGWDPGFAPVNKSRFVSRSAGTHAGTSTSAGANRGRAPTDFNLYTPLLGRLVLSCLLTLYTAVMSFY